MKKTLKTLGEIEKSLKEEGFKNNKLMNGWFKEIYPAEYYVTNRMLEEHGTTIEVDEDLWGGTVGCDKGEMKQWFDFMFLE